MGLLQRWIEQGAKDSHATGKSPIHWQTVPDEYRPILATAVAPAGDVAVCSRGNELFVYGLQPGKQQGQTLATLVDPSLDPAQVGPRGAADLDMIRAVAIHADADWIASAGFRSVKLWQRATSVARSRICPPKRPYCAATADGKQLAIAGEDGSIQLIDLSGQKPRSRGKDTTSQWLAWHSRAAARCWFQPRAMCCGHGKRQTGTPLAGWRLSASAEAPRDAGR